MFASLVAATFESVLIRFSKSCVRLIDPSNAILDGLLPVNFVLISWYKP